MKTLNIQKKFTISAPAGEILPLLCPVREYDWIKGWKCQLVHCPNGKNEKGVIIYEKMSTPFLLRSMRGKTKWITSVFDTTNKKVHFIWINKYAKALYKMELHPITDDSTRLILDLTYTIKNEKGMRKYDEEFEPELAFMIEGIAYMLKHYCENNEMLSTKNSERKKEFVNSLSFGRKFTFLCGRLNLKLSVDKSRKKYKRGQSISISK